MADRYHNEHETQQKENWLDPYAERRIAKDLRPAEPITDTQPDYLRSFEDEKIYFSWLGHSSVFLHMHGLNLMIDPIFSKYSSPVPVPGLGRFKGRIVKAEELPVLDAVLFTHCHYDHLDYGSVRRIDHQVKRYIVPEKVGKILRRFGVKKEKITELGWYEEAEVSGVRVILVPSQHFSTRTLIDYNRTLWGGYVLKDEDFTVFDTGDGGFADHFEEIRNRYGSPDLAIMECGQYNVRWHPSHMFPEESVEAARILDAKLSVPVHWGAYVLSDHAWYEPPMRFQRRAEELHVKYEIPVQYAWTEIIKENRCG